ncbi:MAG: hypothetical protein J6J06_04005 [Bacteroidaceae bacterium]|nr:hypothetical protein [Bacteroidaceae bacterium]
MKKGYLAHKCYCAGAIYHLHTVFCQRNKLLSINPFSNETANTIFCDGMLLVVNKEFDTHKEHFLSLLQQQLNVNPLLTIDKAIVDNEILLSHNAVTGEACSIYSITSDNTLPIATLSILKVSE